MERKGEDLCGWKLKLRDLDVKGNVFPAADLLVQLTKVVKTVFEPD